MVKKSLIVVAVAFGCFIAGFASFIAFGGVVHLPKANSLGNEPVRVYEGVKLQGSKPELQSTVNYRILQGGYVEN